MSTLHADPIRAFGDALLSAGLSLPPDGIKADGALHRYRTEGDKAGCRNAWYLLHLDSRPAGAFGNWRTGYSETWRADGAALTGADAEHFARLIRNAQARAKAERDEAQSATASRARRWWSDSAPASPRHPYLIGKAVEPFGLRQPGALLLVPLTDTTGTLWNLQTITTDGTKRFMKSGRITGLSSLIGDPGDDPARVLICEGWATGATLHSEAGSPVYCAMNCGNLKPVALAVRARFPDADIIICGDDDRHTEGNPGRTKAIDAAAVIGGRVTFPTFAPDETGSDFNDLANLRRRVAA
jgi:putative DNA primase/helicase